MLFFFCPTGTIEDNNTTTWNRFITRHNTHLFTTKDKQHLNETKHALEGQLCHPHKSLASFSKIVKNEIILIPKTLRNVLRL